MRWGVENNRKGKKNGGLSLQSGAHEGPVVSKALREQVAYLGMTLLSL